jgi:putative component of membrane protein insertase Oxa1/YidC/SpoIIIJ protein YidD
LKILLLLLFCLTGKLLSQPDSEKWEAKQTPYELPVTYLHDYTIDKSSFGMTIVSSFRNIYYFFISDLDGDNCPFYPSCSAFFIQAVKETSIFKGGLMFADRFTRDLNLLKGRDHYPIIKSGKFFDPPYNYTLNSQKIKF